MSRFTLLEVHLDGDVNLFPASETTSSEPSVSEDDLEESGGSKGKLLLGAVLVGTAVLAAVALKRRSSESDVAYEPPAEHADVSP